MFAFRSPVTNATRDLVPQSIRIEVATKYLKQPNIITTLRGADSWRKGACMLVDMRPVRIAQRVNATGEDNWESNLIVWTRRRKAHNCLRPMVELEREVLWCCRRYTPHLGLAAEGMNLRMMMSIKGSRRILGVFDLTVGQASRRSVCGFWASAGGLWFKSFALFTSDIAQGL